MNGLLQPGDRMVFFGSDTTEMRIYTRYVANFYALRYPGADVRFRTAGWGGDTAAAGLERLERDVLSLEPTIVCICFGMNDAGYRPFDRTLCDAFLDSTRRMIHILRERGIRAVLLSPQCVDADSNPELRGYNAVLARFIKHLRRLGIDEQAPMRDVLSPMIDAQVQANAEDPRFTMNPDGVHPNQIGHALIACGVLRLLGCDEQPSGLAIDFLARQMEADRCAVEDIVFGGEKVSFTRTDEALPTFFDHGIEAIYPFAPIPEWFNFYPLKISGLAEGRWKVSVEGIESGVFRSEELAEGVNLSTYPGPWTVLGEEVNELSAAIEDTYFTRWRRVSLLEPQTPTLRSAASKLDETLEMLDEARIGQVVAGRTWRWTVEASE